MAEEKKENPDQEIERIQEDIGKKKKEIEEAEKKSQVELFRKYGYKILSDIKYGGEIIVAGSRNKLEKLTKEEIHQLTADGVISR